MGLLDTIISESVGKLIETVSDTVDKFVTTDEERLKLKQAIDKDLMDFKIKILDNAESYEQEITKRLQADMTSDSWLSKNIRPLTLISILTMYSVFSITSGNIGKFQIAESYVKLLGEWGMMIMSFYFGGRSLEKVVSIWKKGKEN